MKARKNKKKHQKQSRNMIVLGMLLTTKIQKFHHKCEERGGDKNLQREFQKEIE